jgi:hypothetical protein
MPPNFTRGAAHASFLSNYDLINEEVSRLMNEGSAEAQASLNLLAVSTTGSVEEREADDVEDNAEVDSISNDNAPLTRSNRSFARSGSVLDDVMRQEDNQESMYSEDGQLEGRRTFITPPPSLPHLDHDDIEIDD